MSNSTIDYYNINALNYFNETSRGNMKFNCDKFLSYLNPSSYILDFGCGSGRDSKYFIEKGHKVKAIDGSKELCVLASKNIGQEVINMDFKDLNEINTFDGIWACASLVHVCEKELLIIIRKMINALKNEGYIYTCFKNGTGEEIDEKGRYYSYYTKDHFKEIINKYPELSVIDIYDMASVTNPNEPKSWNNFILKKEVK